MEKNNKEQQSPLIDFLQQFEKVPDQIVDALLKVTEDNDEKNIINSLAPTLSNQCKELSRFVSERSGMATKQDLNETGTFLRISSGNTLAGNLSLALPSIGSRIGRLGIAGIVQELKKIIMKILELLGISLPKWIDGLINLIDEILNILLGLFGRESMRLRNDLSQLETNFMEELTSVAKLEKASLFKHQMDEDEE